MDCHPDFSYYSFSYPDDDSGVVDFYQNASPTGDFRCVYVLVGYYQEEDPRILFQDAATQRG